MCTYSSKFCFVNSVLNLQNNFLFAFKGNTKCTEPLWKYHRPWWSWFIYWWSTRNNRWWTWGVISHYLAGTVSQNTTWRQILVWKYTVNVSIKLLESEYKTNYLLDFEVHVLLSTFWSSPLDSHFS